MRTIGAILLTVLVVLFVVWPGWLFGHPIWGPWPLANQSEQKNEQSALPPAQKSTTVPPTVVPSVVAQQVCSAYKIDFTHGQGVKSYTIDSGSPNEREIINLWNPGTKETTYILPRMTVIRGLFAGFGNMWKFPVSCDSENLIERAVQYAKDTSPSNHTGEVYLVNADGSKKLITNDAFAFDLSTFPVDPTK